MNVVDSNRLLLDELDTQLDLGFSARDKGENRTASEHISKAEQALLALAKNCLDTELKKQRLSQARRLKDMIEDLSRPTQKTLHPGISVKPLHQSSSGVNRRKDDEQGRCFVPESNVQEVTFNQVAGLADVKREIQLRMVLPFSHPDKAKQFGVSTGGGMLLYGPPGTGKTLIAKATTGELNASFFSVKASDIVAKWFGEAEQNVKNLFLAVRAEKRAVLFIDEIDALIPMRSKSNSSVMARLVPQFLAEMDGFQKNENSLLIIGATNEPWAVDSAMLRPGRFDVMIYMGLPDFEGRRHLLELYFKDKPLMDDVDFDELAEMSEGLSGADIKGFAEMSARRGFEASLNSSIQPLEQNQLMAWLKEIPKSVSQQQLTKFKKFRSEFGR